MEEQRFSFSLSTLRLALTSLVVTISGLGLLAEIGFDIMTARDRDPFGLVGFASLSYEANLPTWIASGLLLWCAALLFLIGHLNRQGQRSYWMHWYALSAIFAYISLDETARLHERWGYINDGAGVLYFSWVIPAMVVTAVLGLLFLPFLTGLRSKTRKHVIVAAVFYVGGALFMEFPLGYWADYAGHHNLVYGLIDWVEETMELIGTALFLYALVVHLLERPLAISME